MNKIFPFSFFELTNTDMLFLSLVNSRVALLVNSADIASLYYSGAIKIGFELKVLSYFPIFSTKTLKAASVGNPLLYTLPLSSYNLDSLHKAIDYANLLRFAANPFPLTKVDSNFSILPSG